MNFNERHYEIYDKRPHLAALSFDKGHRREIVVPCSLSLSHLQIIDANPPMGFLLPVVNLTRAQRADGNVYIFSLSLSKFSAAAAPYLAHARAYFKAGAAIPSG